jgi:hypothetical protein
MDASFYLSEALNKLIAESNSKGIFNYADFSPHSIPLMHDV